MTAFVTKDGKHLPLTFTLIQWLKLKYRQQLIMHTLTVMLDLEVGYVTVTGNVPTCHECARYRDIVFSTKPGDPDFPYINLFTTFPKRIAVILNHILRSLKEMNDYKKIKTEQNNSTQTKIELKTKRNDMTQNKKRNKKHVTNV